MNYHENDTISISIKKFIAIMNSSKYVDFDISTLLEEYLNIKLVTNREEKEEESNKEKEFYQEIIKENSIGSNWLKIIISNKVMPYKIIHQRYNKNKLLLKKELENIINLLDNLPKEKTLLSIYASDYTKNPHYLDLDNNHSNLFFYGLAYLNESSYPKTRTEKIQLLSTFNIEIDNIYNFVITYNLLSDKEYINMFSYNKETLILNIQNIINARYFDTRNKKVFIFENPSVLTEIISNDINCSVIISSGFPNTSVHLLIEKLLQKNNKIYYNGDFDPEGLLIANKLKEKYQDNLILFNYDSTDYNKCISKQRITDKRLKILDKVGNEYLLEIKRLLLENKYSAYQENNKERILEYIVKVCNEKEDYY